jgi:hypothetical protein
VRPANLDTLPIREKVESSPDNWDKRRAALLSGRE